MKDVRNEAFLPSPPVTPRTELILKFDPLDVLKSEEFVINAFNERAVLECKRASFSVDFNDPKSAASSILIVLQQIKLDDSLRLDETAVHEIFGKP